MHRILVIAFGLVCTAGRAFSDPSGEEHLALVDRVQARMAAGETEALDDLTTVPAKVSCPALMAIFKQNRNDASMTSKCAHLLVTVPGGEDFILQLLSREAVNNHEFFQQEIAIKCLVLNHNKTSVRILADTLDYFNPKEMGPYVLRALATLNPPACPVVPKDHAADAEALTQWKQWWSANKGSYLGEPASRNTGKLDINLPPLTPT